MTVDIRLMADSADDLDATELALRTVLDIPAPEKPDYPSRRPGSPTVRRYLKAHGVQPGTVALVKEMLSPLAQAEEAKRSRDLLGEIGALQDADAQLHAQPWYPLQPGDVVLCYLPTQGGGPAYGVTYLAVADDTGIDPDGCAALQQVSSTDTGADDGDQGDDDGQGDDDDPEYDYALRYDDQDTGRWVIDYWDAAPGQWEWVEAWRRSPQEVGDHTQIETAKEWAVREIAAVAADNPVTRWSELPCLPGQIPGWAAIQYDPPERCGDVQSDLEPFYDLWFEAGPRALTVIRSGAVVFGAPVPAGV